MPTPIIELQRRLTLVGAIRAGGEKTDPRRPGMRLGAFRLTSPRKPLVEQAAELYGGAISSWKSPVGDEWQVYTETPELPVLVMPGYSLRQSYELWEGATKRTRLCDGYDEELSGKACLCAEEGVDRCDVYTRLVVALPELDTVLGWRLITRGANAAHELPTMMRLVEAHVAPGQTFVPARLRIDERRGVKDGQVVRFVVPSLDLGVGYLAFAGGTSRALPPARTSGENGDVPEVDPARSLALATALETTTEPRTVRPAREAEYGSVAAPPEPGSDPLRPGEPPTFVPNEPTLPANEQAVVDAVVETFDAEDVTQTKMATAPQKKKLDVVVSKLREGGHIRTPQIWAAVAKMRAEDPVVMVDRLRGREDPENPESRIRWSILRETLTRVEANNLIDRLEAKLALVEEASS